MTRLPTRSTLASGILALSLLGAPSAALAQAPPLSEAIVVGAWTFRPSAELRIRGEYRRDDAGFGAAQVPVQFDLYGDSLSFSPDPQPHNAWALSERARLGLAVDRGPVTAAVTLQDSRVLGDRAASIPGFTSGGLGGLGASLPFVYEAYVDVHSRSGRPMFFRVGRQRVVWGDGRLLGESDWSPNPRALDAARFGFQVSDFDVELMAALLAPPGTYTTPPTGAGGPSALSTRSTGAQLYGLDVKWRFLPLLNAELTGLARISRSYYAFGSPPLTPGDTFVIDARIFGDHRGFQYAVEGAYELGRVASYEVNRDVSAFAVAARASLETALPAHLTFNVHGAYASGDGGEGSNPEATLTRFDPILPDEFANHSPMGLYGWSNIIEVGAGVKATPMEELTLQAGYRFAAFASKGRWITSSLLNMGDVIADGFPILGHELDAAVTFTPWDPIEFKAGYGLFLRGNAAKEIAPDSSGSAMQHWAFLQTLVRAP